MKIGSQGCENLVLGLWKTYNSEQFHQRWVLAFKWQYPNQRGNDSAFQAKLHTFRQTKKITIKVQIYSACVTVIIITSSSIYARVNINPFYKRLYTAFVGTAPPKPKTTLFP